MCFVELVLDGLRCTHLVRGFTDAHFPVHLPNGFATLVGPNKGETAFCGFHCLHEIAVRMRQVLARPWVVCPLFKFALFSMQSNYVQSIFHQLKYFMIFLNKFNSARV